MSESGSQPKCLLPPPTSSTSDFLKMRKLSQSSMQSSQDSQPMFLGINTFNRGRSNSVMSIDQDQYKRASQDTNGDVNCTPSDRIIEPWASQELDMPPTPDHPRKKPKVGLDSMHDLGHVLGANSSDIYGDAKGSSLNDSKLSLSALGSKPANINIFAPEVQKVITAKQKDTTPCPNIMFDTQSLGSSFGGSKVSRYLEEFVEKKRLGRGHGGCVFRCKRNLDGWDYAVKYIRRQLDGEENDVMRREGVREIFAHAALSDCTNIVRYHSAWFENDHFYVQLEYCAQGNVRQHEHDLAGPHLPADQAERNLLELLSQMARALRHMHARSICHLDIKPENIFVCGNLRSGSGANRTTFKLGDFGHVIPCNFPSSGVTEGDQRYCCQELIENPEVLQLEALKACDVFALGATIYDLARGRVLPKSGDEYLKLRDISNATHVLPGLERYSPEFAELIASMMMSNSSLRPSAADILVSTAEMRQSHSEDIDSLKDKVTQLMTQLESVRSRNDRVQGRLDKIQQQRSTVLDYELLSHKHLPQLDEDSGDEIIPKPTSNEMENMN